VRVREIAIRRAAVLGLATCLGIGAVALPANGAAHDPVAAASKKCKKKHRGHRKRRKCKKHRTTPALLSISPMSHDFGELGGPPGPSFTFAVSNTGGSASGIPAASLSGSGVSDFQITANTCTAPLPAVANCSVTVQAVDAAGGTQTAQLTVTATPGGTAAAQLSVTFV
jgi:hypothetical protein